MPPRRRAMRHTARRTARRTSWRTAAMQPEQQEQSYEPYEAEDPPPARDTSYLDELERLWALHESGVLTAEEFTVKKRQVLG